MAGITVPALGSSGWGAVLNEALDGVNGLQEQLFRRALDVMEYGAVGDGVADDTAAVQAALDAGPVVYVPPGTFLVGTLTVNPGQVLVGAGPGGFTTPVPADQVSTLRLKSGTNGPLLNGGNNVSMVQIHRLHLDGNKAGNTSGNVIHIADAATSQQANWYVTDTYVENAAGIGVYVGVKRLAVKLSRVSVYGSGSHGVDIEAADSGLESCMIGMSGGNGIELGAAAWVTHITQCDIWSSTLAGIDSSQGASMVMISGCGIDRHMRQGLLVGGGSVSVTGCVFHSNSQAANATYGHVEISAGAVSVLGCIFGTDSLANNPDYALKPTSTGVVYEWGNRLVAGSTVTGYASDVTKVINTVTGSLAVDIAAQVNIGGSGASSSIAVRRASGSDLVSSSRVGSETVSRYTRDALGTQQWSSGAASADISLSRTAAAQLSLALADFRISTVGKGLRVAEGTGAKLGTATLAAGTVAVANTSVTANSRIFVTSQADGGTPGQLRVSARTAGTSFTITSSSATDTSTVAWMIVEPA